jgi:peptidoglycan/xylan/chitin deacetylase (PgdA/CDA1 family)
MPDREQELFVSLADLETMIEELKRRGFSFGPLDHPGPKTATITFDDGYYNNVQFEKLARSHNVPYLVFVSAYYCLTGNVYPWFQEQGPGYSGVRFSDYYEYFADGQNSQSPMVADDLIRPMTFDELSSLNGSELAEIGCHGYYHQPLSEEFEQYLGQERDLAMECLQDGLGIKPRYFSLANGAYTKRVMSELLETFDRVFTIEGRPYRRNAEVVHRITLLNPLTAGPLVNQIDRHLKPLRQMRRAVRSFTRMRL